ncbi:MAG: hypothetical protein H9W81_03370 [Enterococcus sp.]|nr:hypothetical protein [Enterococcus sp.]
MTSPNRSFGFDDDVAYMYSHGYCWWLAKGLADLTGLTPIAVWAKGSIHHVGVELPNGEVIDIDGVWNRQNWQGFWNRELDYCEDFHVGSTSSDEQHWRHIEETYSPTMLIQDFGLDYTLGEICDTIISILNRYNLLATTV